MTRLIDADALYEQIAKKEELARQRVLDTPSRMPNGDLNPSAIRYTAQLDERTQMKFMIADAPTIDTEPHWIPVSERLPEAPFGCLVTVEDEEPMTGALFPNLLPYFVGWDGEQWNDGEGLQCPFEVIAWMPLPRHYEVKE